MNALIFLSLLLPFGAANVVKLTEENIHELTKGKSMFVKFYAPWCGHCKKIAPIWEDLAKEWKDSDYVLIGEVDCTEEKELCSDYEATSFPTLLFGDPLSPDRYNGKRTIEDLKLFAKDMLKPHCSIYKMDYCSKEEKKSIEALKVKPLSELMEEDERVEAILQNAQDVYDKQVEEMNAKYQEMVKEFNTKMDFIRDNTNYKYIQQILFEYNEKESGKISEL